MARYSAAVSSTEVTYDAEIELKGVRKLVDPLLQLGFRRLGDRRAMGSGTS